MAAVRPSTPAGWFPDPRDPRQQRYWDGLQWTEHASPEGTFLTASTDKVAWTERLLRLAVVVAAVLLIAGVVGLVSTAGSSQTSPPAADTSGAVVTPQSTEPIESTTPTTAPTVLTTTSSPSTSTGDVVRDPVADSGTSSTDSDGASQPVGSTSPAGTATAPSVPTSVPPTSIPTSPPPSTTTLGPVSVSFSVNGANFDATGSQPTYANVTFTGPSGAVRVDDQILPWKTTVMLPPGSSFDVTAQLDNGGISGATYEVTCSVFGVGVPVPSDAATGSLPDVSCDGTVP